MPPAVLGIDTSGTWCSVALLRAGEVHARRAEVGNAHSDHLLQMVDDVLGEAGIALDECAAIAFGAGPGSFTGLRIACAVTQGLAFGAGLPVVAVGTLDALAHSLSPNEVPSRVLVAQDARMGEVYWAVFERVGDRMVARGEPALATPALMRAALAESGCPLPIEVGCGNAWTVHGAALAGVAARVVERAAADAVDVAALGARALAQGRAIDAARAAPLYVRNDVARTTAERAAIGRGVTAHALLR